MGNFNSQKMLAPNAKMFARKCNPLNLTPIICTPKPTPILSYSLADSMMALLSMQMSKSVIFAWIQHVDSILFQGPLILICAHQARHAARVDQVNILFNFITRLTLDLINTFFD